MIEIRVGKFIKKHIDNIINLCKKNYDELKKLQDLQYSREYLGLSGFSFLCSTEKIPDNERYWQQEYLIDNQKFRICSQFGGSQLNNEDLTLSERHGEKFLLYLKNNGILLDEFKNQEIRFIVGSSIANPPNQTPITSISNRQSNSNTKNIILYGPPGVGKTYNHKKLISLIESGENQKDIFDAIKNNKVENDEDLFEIVNSEDRFKIVTFHQSYSYEDFIEGFRPNEYGTIKLEDGIFKEIAEEAKINYIHGIKTEKTLSADKRDEDIFELFIDSIQNEIDINGKYYINKTVYITDVESDAFRYQGENWQNSQRMKFNDIKLIRHFPSWAMDRKSLKDIPGISGLAKQHATYFSYMFKQLFEFADSQNVQSEKVEKTEIKNFYLLIDEINRGNISKIFGELITLIEDDKRDEIEVTLPYSKELFKVPSNLYIIATMNSTDKSIALIDVALRRRFTFLKMQPQNLLVHHSFREKFIKLNVFIEEKIGKDYLLGHSYFMDKDLDLDFVLEYKIKPLLEEYFYSDEDSFKKALEIIENP